MHVYNTQFRQTSQTETKRERGERQTEREKKRERRGERGGERETERDTCQHNTATIRMEPDEQLRCGLIFLLFFISSEGHSQNLDIIRKLKKIKKEKERCTEDPGSICLPALRMPAHRVRILRKAFHSLTVVYRYFVPFHVVLCKALTAFNDGC